MLNDPVSAIFVAWRGVDAIVTATVTTTSQGLEFFRSAELEDLYVIPEARQTEIAGVGDKEEVLPFTCILLMCALYIYKNINLPMHSCL